MKSLEISLMLDVINKLGGAWLPAYEMLKPKQITDMAQPETLNKLSDAATQR